jgi:uncharacterized membrane protein
VFEAVRRVDRPVLMLNLLLLLFVTTIPFSTRSLATYLLTGGSDARLAAVTYGLVIEGVALTFTAICGWMWRARLLHLDLVSVHARSEVLRFGFGSAVILCAVGAALISALLALAIHAVIAVFFAISGPLAQPTASGDVRASNRGAN